MVAGRLPDEGPVRLGSVDLPPGRLIPGWAVGEHIAWVTLDPVPGSGQVWTALSELHLPRTRRPYRPMPDTRIGLVAAERPADVPLVIGWEGPVNWGDFLLPLTAVLRSWEDRFGARVITWASLTCGCWWIGRRAPWRQPSVSPPSTSCSPTSAPRGSATSLTSQGACWTVQSGRSGGIERGPHVAGPGQAAS